MKMLVTILVLSVQMVVGQTVHQLPFASQDNRLELAVENNSTIPLASVAVRLTNPPSWLRFQKTEERIESVEGKKEHVALFAFSVDRSAPVQESYTLIFSLSTPSGESWTKEIALAILPPTIFDLYQNYPNPFNPTTTISYQLAAESRVRLTIFNLLGQEVATPVEGERLAGFHTQVWDASALSTGVYVYRLLVEEKGRKPIVFTRTMVLVR